MHVLTQRRRGFSLVEMVVYIGVVSLLTSVLVATLIPLARVYGNLAASRDVNASAYAALDRFVREARAADAVISAESVLGAHPGSITFAKTDSERVATSVRFSLVGGALHVFENDVDVGPLTRASVTVESLVFRYAASGSGKMASVEVTLTGSHGRATKTAPFSAGAVLRGSYSGAL